MFSKIRYHNKSLELKANKIQYKWGKKSFFEKFEEFQDRKSRLELKKREQKNRFMTFVPFIQLCQRRVMNSKQKSIVNRWVIEKLSKNIELKNKETMYLQNKLSRIKVSLDKHYMFKVFMDKTVRESPAIHTSSELMNRYSGLVLCNKRLNTIQEEASDNVSKLRSKRAVIRSGAQRLGLLNQLTILKNKYSTQSRQMKKLQAYLDSLVNHATQKILVLANIRVVTNELYRMIEPKESTQDTFAQLTKIGIHGEKLQASIKYVVELCKKEKKYLKDFPDE
ncbi:hypothetical protein Ahia01_000939400 [Argonauta hians]